MSKRFALTAVAVLLAAAVGYGAWWWWLAHSITTRLNAWIAAERSAGVTVAYDQLAVGGFPFAVTLQATTPHILLPDGTAWVGEHATATIALWRPQEVAVVLGGQQRATLPAAGARPTLALATRDNTGDVMLNAAGAVQSVDLMLNTATLTVASAAIGLSGADLHAALPLHPPADHTQVGLTLGATIARTSLPDTLTMPLGHDLTNLTIGLRVMGRLPGQLRGAAIDAWSRDGGTVELDALHLGWGPLILDATGTLALDESRQPMGALTAHIEGMNQAIDALSATGAVRPGDAQTAKTVVGLLAQPGADGKKAVTAPITAQNGWLYLGPVRLARLPPITIAP